MAALLVAGPPRSIRAQTGVTYAYDDAGRLVGVVDTAGNAASYTYDLVGNLLSITRYTSAQVVIFAFTPRTGPVGTRVTISGSGFGTTVAQNTVNFNGVVAPIDAASATQPFVQSPDGRIWTAHPEDDGHWRHWDRQDPDGGNPDRYPENSLKPRPNQKKPPKDRCDEDPNGDKPGWTPPFRHPMTAPGLPFIPLPLWVPALPSYPFPFIWPTPIPVFVP